MPNPAASGERIARVRTWMEREGADAFLLRNTSDIAWATAFGGVFDEEQAHALLITHDAAVLHTDSRYSEACNREAQDGPVEVDARPCSHAAWCADRLPRAVALAFDDTMSLREHRALVEALQPSGVALCDSSDVVLNLRARKDAWEVAHLKAAQAITDAAFEHIAAFARAGLTERQVQLELDSFMRAQGADGLAFATIVATGAHGSSPHAQPGEAVLAAGDAVVMDFGARKDGYCSDMTRMLFVGEPADDVREAYAVLRRANEECEAMVRAGVVGKDVHANSQRILEEGGFGGLMGHGLGHGVGLDIHENPNLNTRNTEPLPAGAVVTVEPGIYIPGRFGMRLEDFGLVTPDGFDVFTRSTHEMVIV